MTARGAVETWLVALQAQLRAMQHRLEETRSGSGQSHLDADAAAACVTGLASALSEPWAEAQSACHAARADSAKPGAWDELLGSVSWEAVHEFVLAADGVPAAFDRLDIALLLAQHGTFELLTQVTSTQACLTRRSPTCLRMRPCGSAPSCFPTWRRARRASPR